MATTSNMSTMVNEIYESFAWEIEGNHYHICAMFDEDTRKKVIDIFNEDTCEYVYSGELKIKTGAITENFLRGILGLKVNTNIMC